MHYKYQEGVGTDQRKPCRLYSKAFSKPLKIQQHVHSRNLTLIQI